MKKPMLAGKADLKALKYPVLCTPKIDGVRALKPNGVLVSRNWKPIPNTYLRGLFSSLPNGVDGELVGENGTPAGLSFNETQSLVMSNDGTPNVTYRIFDYVTGRLDKPYIQRMDDLKMLSMRKAKGVQYVLPIPIASENQLLQYEAYALLQGYEGIMIRSVSGPYKEGRSTVNEGYLLKLKRFDDSEARIVGFNERMHNANEAEEDAFGHTKRSQAKDGLVPDGTLGKLLVVDIHTKCEFEIGTGFTQEMRDDIWANRAKWQGKIVKYKFQPSGMKDKPRFPVYIGLSNEGK